MRLFQRQPMTVGLEPPLQHEFRLALLLRDQADDVLIQTWRHCVGFNVGIEAVFVFLVSQFMDLLCFGRHSNSYKSSIFIRMPVSGRSQATFSGLADRPMRGISGGDKGRVISQSVMLFKRLVHRLINQMPIRPDRARRFLTAVSGSVYAFRHRKRSIECADDVGHGDLVRTPRQSIAAVCSPVRQQQSRRASAPSESCSPSGSGSAARCGQLARAQRQPRGISGKFRQQQDPVVRLFAHPNHRRST